MQLITWTINTHACILLAEDKNTHETHKNLGQSPGQNPHLCEVKPKKFIGEREKYFTEEIS